MIHRSSEFANQLKSEKFSQNSQDARKIFSLFKRPSVILKELILKLNTELLSREKAPKTIPFRGESA